MIQVRPLGTITRGGEVLRTYDEFDTDALTISMVDEDGGVITRKHYDTYGKAHEDWVNGARPTPPKEKVRTGSAQMHTGKTQQDRQPSGVRARFKEWQRRIRRMRGESEPEETGEQEEGGDSAP